jgi:hypothetical protein
MAEILIMLEVERIKMDRRKFIKSSLIAGAALFVPTALIAKPTEAVKLSWDAPTGFMPGDIFTIAGVYDPETKELKKFVVSDNTDIFK